jgi:hypothetical protein
LLFQYLKFHRIELISLHADLEMYLKILFGELLPLLIRLKVPPLKMAKGQVFGMTIHILQELFITVILVM